MPVRTHIIQHLYKHGNSTGVTIPRDFLLSLGWKPGDFVISQLLEDKRGVVVRLATSRDLNVHRAPQLEPAAPAPVQE